MEATHSKGQHQLKFGNFLPLKQGLETLEDNHALCYLFFLHNTLVTPTDLPVFLKFSNETFKRANPTEGRSFL